MATDTGPYVHEYLFEDADGNIDIAGVLNDHFAQRLTFVAHTLDVTKLGTRVHLFVFHRSQYLDDYYESLRREQFEKDCVALCSGCLHKLRREYHPEFQVSKWLHYMDNGTYAGPCYAEALYAAWEVEHGDPFGSLPQEENERRVKLHDKEETDAKSGG